ncbi:MAG: ELWxxDGT repeat protein, partial [Planctomycetaceae bacterium]
MAIRQMLATLIPVRRKSRRRNSRISQHSVLESLERRELLAADVSVLKDILPGSASSLPNQTTPTEFNGQVYFSANDGVRGFELWRTDGTGGGTQLFIDLTPGSVGSFPKNFIVSNGKLFFTTQTGMFVTDGTQAGTTQLLASAKNYSGIAAVGGTVFYYLGEPPIGNSDSPGGTFWKTDGTVANTVSFLTWNKAGGPINPAVFDNAIFFVAPGSSTLYKLNPALDTVAEVSSAFTVDPGSDSYPAFVVSTAGLFFAGREPSVASVLWILNSADGTPSKVQAPDSGSIAKGLEYLTTSNNRVYFTAFTLATSFELWSSDGTSAGTSMVKEIIPGSMSPGITALTDVDGVLFFSANNGVHGIELWKSEGLASNTIMVKDIVPGSDSSAPRGLFNLNGLLTFFARNPESLSETLMWSSDGTDAGTMPIGAAPISPAFPVALGNSEIFAGENSTVGRELFIARIGIAPATPVVTGPVAVTKNLRPTVTWNAVPGVTKYEVWIRNTSTNQNPLVLET